MTPTLPTWVQKRDGRREPFDADKISQSIFAATEVLGTPNAFLARELTDGVLHFLGEEGAETEPTTSQIAELVAKVVRELGQPALAVSYSQCQLSAAITAPTQDPRQETLTFSVDDDPYQVIDDFHKAFHLRAVYGRDIIAAHESGLISIWGLRNEPQLLDAIVLSSPSAQVSDPITDSAWKQVREAAIRARWLAVDSAEILTAIHGPIWLQELVLAVRATGLDTCVNLNIPTPPAWAASIASGPLFGAANAPAETRSFEAVVAVLRALESAMDRALESEDICRWTVTWHLSAADFENAKYRLPLEPLLANAKLLPFVTFTLHRDRRSVMLGHGLDRSHPAVLQRTILPLIHFLQCPEVSRDGAKMIAKMASLVRMAVSAGVQKRNYLRRHCPELSREFLLDRACMVIEPFDVEDVIWEVAGTKLNKSNLALEFGRHLLMALHQAAREAGKAANLDTIVGNFQSIWIDNRGKPEESEATWKAAGALLEVIDCGAVRVRLERFGADEVWRHLQCAWQNKGISRVSFCL